MKILNYLSASVILEVPGDTLVGANLQEANLEYASLYNANLQHANLQHANLENARLQYANLQYANLEYTNLEKTNLHKAILTGTCLDSNAPIPEISDEDIKAAGLTIRGKWVYGYRTSSSQHCGKTIYLKGKTYRAPVFSVSPTECHPGIYLDGKDWLYYHQYPMANLVRCRTLRSNLHRAGSKWRTKELEIV